MSEREQVEPSDPLSFTNSSNDDHQAIFINDRLKSRRRRRNYVQCCGCVTAVVLIIAVTFLIFSFTVYNLKEPQLRLNSVTLTNSTHSSNVNKMTLTADVSVKNPNVFTFRFDCTTTLYHNGTGIGEGVTPPGKAMGRKTLRLNVTVEIMTEKLMESDVMREKALNISSYTKVVGNVKVLNLIKRKVEVQMNCSVIYNMTSGSTHGEACFTGVGF